MKTNVFFCYTEQSAISDVPLLNDQIIIENELEYFDNDYLQIRREPKTRTRTRGRHLEIEQKAASTLVPSYETHDEKEEVVVAPS